MLNISKQIYYVWNTKTTSYPLQEVEIIPGGESSIEKKRIEKANTKYKDIKEYENRPLPGFTLFKTNRRKYGSADPTWLIIDPRGFLTRITNENLEEILDVTGITEGLIQERCVWAREDSQSKLTLIPISSPLYIDAVKNTELLDNKVELKDVQMGDTVLLQNGLTGTYMGVLSLYGPIKSYVNERDAQTFVRRQIIEVEHGKFHYQTNLKILKVIKKTEKPMTKAESVIYINACISKGGTYFTNTDDIARGYYSTQGMIKLVSEIHLSNVPIELLEINYDEAVKLFDEANKIADSGMLMCESAVGEQFLIDFPYSITPGALSISKFAVDNVLFDRDNPRAISMMKSTYSYYERTRKKEHHGLDKFTKFYTIVKHVKDKSYV